MACVCVCGTDLDFTKIINEIFVFKKIMGNKLK